MATKQPDILASVAAARLPSDITSSEYAFAEQQFRRVYGVPDCVLPPIPFEHCPHLIDLTKSSGIPFNLKGMPTKQSTLTAEGGFTPLLQESLDNLDNYLHCAPYTRDLSAPPIIYDRAKDELRPPDKHVRLIGVLPMHMMIYMVSYFFHFRTHFLSKRNVSPIVVGINPTSLDWSDLWSKHSFDTPHTTYDGDVKGQEFSTTVEDMESFARVVCDYILPQHHVIATAILMCVANSFHLVGDGITWFIYQMLRGHPSGHYLTTEFNSYTLFIRYVVALHRLSYTPPITIHPYSYVTIYGDDSLLTLLDSANITFQQICQMMLRMGFIMDCADKRYRGMNYIPPRDTLSLLKRSFTSSSGTLYPRLELASIFNSISYMQKKDRNGNKFVSRLISAHQEVSLYDRDIYDTFIVLATKSLTTLGINLSTGGEIFSFPTYDIAHSRATDRCNTPSQFLSNTETDFLI